MQNDIKKLMSVFRGELLKISSVSDVLWDSDGVPSGEGQRIRLWTPSINPVGKDFYIERKNADGMNESYQMGERDVVVTVRGFYPETFGFYEALSDFSDIHSYVAGSDMREVLSANECWIKEVYSQLYLGLNYGEYERVFDVTLNHSYSRKIRLGDSYEKVIIR